ncbi:hypothetical protein RHSIM_Rhsim10G0070800 [Rhododendron simsii]|uniref:Uncharacterized protein n=1 Tax=Rhododendron simsii TaxID=118357 RepID=A0A834GBF2_RHOSS|nr:hypothetical protein RHSIM_Rhsim10G0070800 [Rhododendron simsii]
MSTSDLSVILPRVLIVSRRSVRKNKFVDFVGEYHLDLIVSYGAVPVIVPRVSGVHMLLDSFEPIHGVLLCEGEDIDPSFYETETSSLSPEELEAIRKIHASDTTIDKEKDTIELRLAKLCLERNIPYMGICRGSQVLNVASGGTLYQDIGKELSSKLPENQRLVHMDYDNYDGHRHRVKVVENTPLEKWFKKSLEGGEREIMENSYHHQGVKRLAQRFVPMAFGSDGLVEGFYDPDAYNPGEGKFIMGLQFHPERMRKPDSDEFDYPGCPSAYQEFVKAVIAYQKRLNSSTRVPKSLKLDKELEKKREDIEVSLLLGIYMLVVVKCTRLRNLSLEPGQNSLRTGARPGGMMRTIGWGAAAIEKFLAGELFPISLCFSSWVTMLIISFLNIGYGLQEQYLASNEIISCVESHEKLHETVLIMMCIPLTPFTALTTIACGKRASNTPLSLQQEKRLKQMGATVRNASACMNRLKVNEDRANLARKVIEKMSVENVTDLMSFYHIVDNICSEVLEIEKASRDCE